MRGALAGPLRRRLLLAFLLVALVSVLVVAAAALIGVGYGFTAAEQGARDRAAQSAASAAAEAYRAAGGWGSADLSRAADVADAAGGRLVVLDATGAVVHAAGARGPAVTGGAGQGATNGAGPAATGQAGTGQAGTGQAGMGQAGNGQAGNGQVAGQGGAGQHVATASVVVDGTAVGTVRLVFGSAAATRGRDVAWTWIAVGAGVTLAVAWAVGWFVSRALTRPLGTVTAAARALAAGDGTARTRLRGTGEIAELGGAFDAMADSLARAQQDQRTLTADVAHELRTPLAALQAGLEELRDGLVEPDGHTLAGLHDQSLRLARLVDDLAELSAAESAGVPRTPEVVDLADLARDAVTARLPELRTAGLSVATELQPGVLVSVDTGRLHQALGNVLANAARYCRPGDHVDVRVRAEGPEAVVELADSGPGIPPDELPHVFDRLWRGRAGRSVAGSGIGLAVARQIVLAHHGSVTAGSPAEGGTTIVVRLPLAPKPA